MIQFGVSSFVFEAFATVNSLLVTRKLSMNKMTYLFGTHPRVSFAVVGHYTQVLDSSLVERVLEEHYCYLAEAHPAAEVPRVMAAEGQKESVPEAKGQVPTTRVTRVMQFITIQLNKRYWVLTI